MYTCIVYNGKYLSKYLNDSRFPVFQFVKSKLTLHCVDPLGKKKFKFEQIANRYAKWAAIRWESGQKVVDRGEIVASRAIHLSTNTEATKKVRTCLGRKRRRSSVRGGSMGCRVVLSSCQECNSHAAGIPFHSIPLAASLLWPCTGAASRGGGGLLFHLATSRSLLDPSPSRETERERESTFRIAKPWIVFSLVSVKRRIQDPFVRFEAAPHSFVDSGSITGTGKKSVENGGRLGLGELTLIRTD